MSVTASAADVEAPTEATKSLAIADDNKSEDAAEEQSSAVELLEAGKQLKKEKNHGEASNLFGQALECMVAEHGQLALETSEYYFEYGSSILEECIQNSDVLGSIVKEQQTKQAEEMLGVDEEDEKADEKEDDGDEKANDDDDDDKEDDAAPQEDENVEDRQLAWETLECARSILETSVDDGTATTHHKKLLGDTYSRLADCQMEEDQWDNAYNDYNKCIKVRQGCGSPRSIASAHMSAAHCLMYSAKNDAAKTHYAAAKKCFEALITEKVGGVDKAAIDKYIADGGDSADEVKEFADIVQGLAERVNEMSKPAESLKDLEKNAALPTGAGAPTGGVDGKTQIGFGTSSSDDGPVNNLGTFGSPSKDAANPAKKQKVDS